MAERRIEHTFECSIEKYWEVTFSPEFNRSLFLERLRFERWEITATEELPHGFRRTIEAIPPSGNLPGPLKSLLKQGTAYREEGEYNRDEGVYRLRAISKSLPEKLLVSGIVRAVSLGENRCHRTYDAKVEAKIFGIGGMLEERVLNDLEKSVNRSAEHTEMWLKR